METHYLDWAGMIGKIHGVKHSTLRATCYYVSNSSLGPVETPDGTIIYNTKSKSAAERTAVVYNFLKNNLSKFELEMMDIMEENIDPKVLALLDQYVPKS